MENIAIVFLIIVLASVAIQPLSPQQQQKADIQQAEIEYRDSIGLLYGQNTETLTFSLRHKTDFVIKNHENQEVKGTIHIYWKQENVYISSQYRKGQNARLVIYEDNYRIIVDQEFYVASGFKFTAEKGKQYTIRLIDEGKITKLVAMELSKSLSSLEKTATLAEYQHISNKIQSMEKQIRSLFTISEFSDILHQKNFISVIHTISLYMTYLITQSCIIFGVVYIQIRYMTKLLHQQQVV